MDILHKKGNETKYTSGQISIFSSKSCIGKSKPYCTRFSSIQSKMILLYIYSIKQDPIYFENLSVLVDVSHLIKSFHCYGAFKYYKKRLRSNVLIDD